MHFSGQYQSPEEACGSVDWGATISGSSEASLAYPQRNDDVQPELRDQQYHRMIAQTDSEGLGSGCP